MPLTERFKIQSVVCTPLKLCVRDNVNTHQSEIKYSKLNGHIDMAQIDWLPIQPFFDIVSSIQQLVLNSTDAKKSHVNQTDREMFILCFENCAKWKYTLLEANLFYKMSEIKDKNMFYSWSELWPLL